MTISTYDIIYLVSNVFGTYTIYKFMRVFFDGDETDKRSEVAVYASYFLIIGTMHIMFNNPILNLLSNLILFFVITRLYSSSMKLRIMAVVCIYTVLISVETITILISSMLNLNVIVSPINIDLILALITSKILSYIVILFLSNLKMIKSGIDISGILWFAVVSIPLGTLYTTFVLVTESNQYNFMRILISIVILFIINFCVFYLYEYLLKSYQEKMETNLLKQQNKVYIQQLKMMTRSQDDIKRIRHDMKFHISTIQGLVEKSNNTLALDYIKKAYSLTNFPSVYAKSGNVEVDSILNYKIHEAKKQGIEVDLELLIPERLNFEPIDIIIVLGNLIDNAIDATEKLKKDKKIAASIKYTKNILYVNIANPFDHKILCRNNKLLTTHSDKENRGLGLKSVEKSIKKYNGSIEISHIDNHFSVDILLYNPIPLMG